MIKTIWKVIKSIAFSVVFLAIVVHIVTDSAYFFREKDKNIDTITGFYEQENNSLDAVFVGSSSMYRFYISPEAWNEYGYTSFTYSSAAMPFEATPYVLKEINRTQNPKLVVIDTRNFVKQTTILLKDKQTDEEKAYLEKTNSFIYNVTNNMPYNLTRAQLIHSFVPNNLKDQNEIEWQFDLASTHNNWKDKTLGDLKDFVKLSLKGEQNKAEAKKELLATNCVRVKYKTRKQVKWLPTKEQMTEKSEIPSERLKIIDDIIDYAKKSDMKILFLSTPYSTNIDYWKVENFLAQYVEDAGFSYLNCNLHYDDIGIDFNTDYYDDRHTNAMGAQKFTKYIGKYITENFEIEKTSSDKMVQKQFDAAYAEWKKVSTPKIEALKKSNAA